MKKYLIFFITVFCSFCSSSYCADNYLEINLPAELHIDWKVASRRCLNNKGQVAGYIGSRKKVGSNYKRIYSYSEKAVIWDPIDGIKCCPLLNDTFSKAISVNDYGLVAVESFIVTKDAWSNDKEACRPVLWDSNTNEIKFGPCGRIIEVNNEGLVLIKVDNNKNEYTLWNSSDGTIKFLKNGTSFQLLGLTDNGKPYSGIPNKNNEFYSENLIKDFNGALVWFYDDINHLLTTNDNLGCCINNYQLNNSKDAVIAKTAVGEIIKFRQNNDEKTESSARYDIKVFLGFSDSGKILFVNNSNNFCLLTPNF